MTCENHKSLEASFPPQKVMFLVFTFSETDSRVSFEQIYNLRFREKSGHTYHIVGNFVENKIFAGNFADCSLVLPKDATYMPKFCRENFCSHKTSKFVNVFSLESFSLYRIKLDYQYLKV